MAVAESGAVVIGLMGKKQSGKDSVADVLVGAYGFQRIALADPVRHCAMALDPEITVGLDARLPLSTIVKRMGWDEAKTRFSEVRRWLQKIGTEMGRDVLGEDIWTDIASNRIDEALTNGISVVVTDVRFPNEAAMVRFHGGAVLEIVRPGVDATDTHRSENEWQTVTPTAVILNTGTLFDLEHSVHMVMAQLGVSR